MLRQTGLFLALNELEDLVRRLDAAMIFEGPTFAAFHQSYRESGRRPAALAGRSYAATCPRTAGSARTVFRGCQRRRTAGPRRRCRQRRAFRGILSPHIDFHRGGQFTPGPTKNSSRIPTPTPSLSWAWPISIAGGGLR